MKKTTKTMLLSLGLVGLIGTGATLAYFSDSGNLKNTFTFGEGYGPNGEGFKLWEYEYDNEKGELTNKITETGTSYANVKPAETLSKNPTITLNASVKSYLFIALDKEELKSINVDSSDLDWKKWKNVEDMTIFKDDSNKVLENDIFNTKQIFCYTNGEDSLAKANEQVEIGIFDQVVVNKDISTKPEQPLELNIKGAAIQSDATPTEALNLAISAFSK